MDIPWTDDEKRDIAARAMPGIGREISPNMNFTLPKTAIQIPARAY
jgi:hypothetical protein